MRVLFSWISLDEVLRAEGDLSKAGLLSGALQRSDRLFDQVVLLNNLPPARARAFVQWAKSPIPIEIRDVSIANPVDYGTIHTAAVEAVEEVRRKVPLAEVSFFLNSGTPPMGAVWMLLGKSRYAASLYGWSTHSKALEKVEVPFDISAEFIREQTSSVLREASVERARADAAFDTMIRKCELMETLIDRAQRVAGLDVFALIEGESGTGKEVLARAIHNASRRRSGPFIAVNCGAIPENLIESELFGHVKGAFTGAEPRLGHFREANGGTLFLDEIGELPLAAQVRLLRPLEANEVMPVGASKAVSVNVRVIAATHRNLMADVGADLFREDLFYRLAVAILRLPALREREGDLSLLVDHLLGQINAKNLGLGISERTLSGPARQRLRAHAWPGNIRELASTLRRAIVWSKSPVLQVRDIEEALLALPGPATEAILSRPIGAGFKLDALLDEVQSHYIKRATTLAKGRPVATARLLGISHQVLANRTAKS